MSVVKVFLYFIFIIIAPAHQAQAQTEETVDDFESADFVEEDAADLDAVDSEETAPAGEGEILNQIEELNKFSDEQIGLKPFVYSERGRKSPFKRPSGIKQEVADLGSEEIKLSGLEGYDLDAFEVTAVLWDIKFPKALVKSPNDEVFQVEEGTKIGRNSGYVAKIREGEVVIVEAFMPNGDKGRKFYKTQVLKLGR